MAPRAIWKGYLKLEELSCPVSLHSAVSELEKVSLHMVNRATGHRLRRQFIDGETGAPVERAAQVKGYESDPGAHVLLEPEEIAAARPQGEKTLAVERFVACDAIDDLYLDRPYYLSPSNAAAMPAFVLIREGLNRRKVAAIAHGILFRRVWNMLIRASGSGLIATALRYVDEVQVGADIFERGPERAIEPEMLELATHIVETKRGAFDPALFEDRYETALAALVAAKQQGRSPFKPRAPKPTKATDLLEALRRSAAAPDPGRPHRSRSAASHRKAG